MFVLNMLIIICVCGIGACLCFIIDIKNRQIQRLIEQHKQATLEMTNRYYNEMMSTNHYKNLYYTLSRSIKTNLNKPTANNMVSWRVVFGYSKDYKVTPDMVQARYRKLAAIHHPDVGGSEYGMKLLNLAKEKALKEVA